MILACSNETFGKLDFWNELGGCFVVHFAALLGVQGRFVKGGSTEFVLSPAAVTPLSKRESSKITSEDVLETSNVVHCLSVGGWAELGL